MGSILLCGASKGRRLLYPHSRVLIHQPHGELPHGQATDIGLWAEDFLAPRKKMNEILALSDRVIVMREGNVAAEIQPSGSRGRSSCQGKR